MSPTDKRRVLVDYLRMKLEDGDWHGVQDAASDLRDLEAANPEVCAGPRVVEIRNRGVT